MILPRRLATLRTLEALHAAGSAAGEPEETRARRHLLPAIRPCPPVGPWQRFESSSFELPPTRSVPPDWSSLDAAIAPPGPYKLLPAGAGSESAGAVRLVGDLPLDLDPLHGRQATGSLPSLPEDFELSEIGAEVREEEVATWSAGFISALETLATPRARRRPASRSAAPASAPQVGPMPQVDSHPGGGATPSQVEFLGGGEGLAEVLGGRGWEVSRIQDEIRVTFSSPRFFKQVSIIERGGGGLLLEMELASTAEWSKVSFEAAAALILRTNERLRLARIVCDFTGDRRLLLAQVHLGRLPVNSPWIDTALDSLRATATLVAEPLPALAEGVLARQVLQASCCGSATHP